jgi:class 3 adenylate cyclase/ligand-binding sensor domain-containing protein
MCNLLLLFSLFFSTAVFSQKEKIDFKLFSFEEGLSHRNAFKIQQDPYGYIWVATINGLNKYDGTRFTHFNNLSKENYIPQNYVSELLVTSDTMIWMAGENNLIRLNGRNYQYQKVNTSKESIDYNKNRTPGSLVQDDDGNIWNITYQKDRGESFLQKLGNDNQLKDVMKCKGNSSKRAMIWAHGHIYFANSSNELLKIHKEGTIIQQYTFPKETNNKTWIVQMQIDEDETLWAIMDDGLLYSLSKGENEFRVHPVTKSISNSETTNSLLVEKNGDIWIGGLGILFYLQKSTGRLTDYRLEIKELTDNYCNIRHLFQDEMGIIWAASEYGVIKITHSEKIFDNYLAEGSEYCTNGFCSIRGITEDEEGNIYFSYYNSIHILKNGEDTPQPLFPRNDYFNFPFGLTYYKNALWTGNGRRIDLETQKVDTIFNKPSIDLGVCIVSKENNLWFAYRNWIYIYNPEIKELKEFQDHHQLIDTSELDAAYLYQGETKDYIWLSTLNDGLYKIDSKQGVMAHYTNDSSSLVKLISNRINVTYEDNNGNLWIGTAQGMQKLDIQKETIQTFSIKNGMPNNFINGLLSEGDTALWMSTDVGISRMSIANESFINFYKQNGLTTNEFNRISFYQTQDGRLYFGSIKGVNAFYPNNLSLKEKKIIEANLILTSLSKLDGVKGEMVNYKNDLSSYQPFELTYQDKFFVFNFALTNYKNPSEIIYSYILEGYDSDWSEASGATTARFNGIPAGDYTFKVRAAANKNDWNKKELIIKLKVHQAYFKTWWFILCCGTFGVGVLFLAYRYRVYSLEENEKELEREVQVRTNELEREKKKSDDLLLNILPIKTADELKKYGKAKAKRHDSVTVFFSDFKDFTKISQDLGPEQLVNEIDFYFKAFDRIIEKYELEKIKTIGDAYMCVSGMSVKNEKSASQMVLAALEIQEFLEDIALDKKSKGQLYFEARIGLHTGPVVAGIVGIKKFAFDIWGDTVNTASRMEQNGAEKKVNISESTYQLVKNNFDCEHRGKVMVKHIGEIDMYFVTKKVEHN